jgi:hypothetical protein
MREGRRLGIWLLAWAHVFAFSGCRHTIDGLGSSGTPPGSLIAGILGNNDLGLAIFNVYRGQIQQDPDPTQRANELAALDASKTDFVAAVNAIANTQTLAQGVQTAQSIFSLVDDGTIPNLANDFAQIIQLLQGDATAQTAILSLAQSSPSSPRIPLDDLIGLLGKMSNYPDVTQLWQAAAGILQQNPTLVKNLVGLASRSLQNVQPPGQTAGTIGKLLAQLDQTLLGPAQLQGTSFGTPQWVVTLDDRGYPLVAKDSSGAFVAPFTDDGTGHAAVDSSGNFIDASGSPISIAPYGTPNTSGFDSVGRGLTPSGELAFVYLDSKATVLALALKLGGDLLRQNLDQEGIAVLQAALGPQNPDLSYQDGPVEDLTFAGCELLAPDETVRLVSALSTLLRTDPTRAQQLLVQLGEAIDQARAAKQQSAQAGGIGGLSLSNPKVEQLTANLLPVLDGIATAPSSGGQSTLRVLFTVLQSLNQTVPNWPDQVASLVTLHQVSPPIPVDSTKAAFYVDANNNTVDNRSAAQTLLDLLAVADGCAVPFTGETLADLIIDMMASSSPGTAGFLGQLVAAVPGGLLNLACNGISADITALDDLASSGSLDAFLPIAKAFHDAGETKLLVAILVQVDKAYSVIGRPFEPDTGLLLSSGAVGSICALLGETTTIQDPTSGLTLADIIADGIAVIVNQHSSNVHDRHGQSVPSLAFLLLDPLQAIDARVVAAGALSDEGAMADAVVSVLLARTTNPGTGQTVLANGCVVPLLSNVLDMFTAALPSDTATRRADLSQAEQSAIPFLLSSDFGDLVSLESTILASPGKATIDAAVVNLLTPNAQAQDDIFGSVCKLGAIALQASAALPKSSLQSIGGAVADLSHFLGQAIDPSRPFVQDLIVGVTKVLTLDQGGTILSVMRAACNPPASGGSPPLSVIIRVIQSVSTAGGQGTGVTAASLQSALASALAFMETPGQGLQAIFTAILNRHK